MVTPPRLKLQRSRCRELSSLRCCAHVRKSHCQSTVDARDAVSTVRSVVGTHCACETQKNAPRHRNAFCLQPHAFCTAVAVRTTG